MRTRLASAGHWAGSRVRNGSRSPSSSSWRPRSSSEVIVTLALNRPAARAQSRPMRASSSSTQRRGRSTYCRSMTLLSSLAAVCPSGSSGISKTRPLPRAYQPLCPRVTSSTASSARRCSSIAASLASTRRASSAAVAGPCCRSRSWSASRTGSARARIALGSVSTRSPTEFSSGMSGLGQALCDAVEEGAPSFLGALVHLGRQRSALLEEHLGAAVADVGEDDGDELVSIFPGRLLRDREAEPLRLGDLAVLAVPADLAAAGLRVHRQPPRAAGPDVHRDRRQRHLGLGAAEPVGERLGLGPLLPDALARRVEHAGDRDSRLSHRGARPGGRSFPARSDGTPPAIRPRPRAAYPPAAPAAAAPSGRA